MADASQKMRITLKEMGNKIWLKTISEWRKSEWKIKAMIYSTIATLIDGQKEILELLQKMYIALKDVTVEELQKEFVVKLAEIIHDENKDKTE